MQEDENGLMRPVAFASRKLTATEQRYSATERELLAIVYAFDQFNSNIYGRHVKVYTDHKPLVTMAKLKRIKIKEIAYFSVPCVWERNNRKDI